VFIKVFRALLRPMGMAKILKKAKKLARQIPAFP
jgi:hypothetical protein